MHDNQTAIMQHFIYISDAMTYREGDNEVSLWNDQDGMYYDAIEFGPGNTMQLPVRSLVGLIPLYATMVLEPAVLNRFPGFKKRVEWFLDNWPEVSARNMANMKSEHFCLRHKFLNNGYLNSGWKGTEKASGTCEQRTACQDSRKNVR